MHDPERPDDATAAKPQWRGAPAHPREAERLQALQETGLLGGAPDGLQQAVVRLASQICGTPISAVSLVDADRQWFSAIHGLQVRETPREVAFCAHTILADVPLVVPDATSDERFSWNPLVTGAPGIRFYAGIPLNGGDGLPFGSLCVIDRVPRKLSDEQLESLRTLGQLVGSQLELYRRNRQIESSEAAQKEVTDRFSKIASRVPGMIYQLRQRPDGTSCFPYASEGIRSIFGVTPEQVRDDSSGVFSMLHPEDIHSVAASIQASVRTLEPWTYEFRVRVPDGTIRWMRGDAVPEREIDGGTLWHGLVTDITAGKQTKADLLAMTKRFELAAQAGGVGTWDWDIEANQVIWDDQMYRLYGTSREQFGGAYEAWHAGVHPDDRVRGDEEIQQALLGEKSFDTQFRVVRPDGAVRTMRAIALVHRDQTGTAVRMIGTNWDVTEETQAAELLRQAQRAAESASRAKSAFLANMSHEIRTPLTAILGFADVLLEDGETHLSPAQRNQTIDTIRNAGQHLLTLINDILDLSKIEADRMTVERIETLLPSILRDVAELLRSKAEGKGVALKLSLSTPVPDRIIADPTRLRQILMNLAGNAVKFTESGQVSIVASAGKLDSELRLIIDVEDTGPGMTPAQSKQLFQVFSQADESVARKFGGTGLGLTISRRLAALMGGDVTLVRTQPGIGSCFRLMLPLEAAAQAAMVDTLAVSSTVQAAPAVPKKLNGRILLAEDGPDNQRLISFHLRVAGATVDIAENGRVALDMIDKSISEGTRYDLIVTDIQMPEMDGYTLARTIRQRGISVPIIALTANAMAEDRERCMVAGCDDYASKPIDKSAMIATCARWIGRMTQTAGA